tara:strand:+ start:190 stop:363 length:174 start_codon:yes stop_codon:yes gene_type:complete
LHPREKVLGLLEYHSQRGEQIPQSTLELAKFWGVSVLKYQNNTNTNKENNEDGKSKD